MPAYPALDPATPLHAHLQARGPMSENSPELQRIAKATGYSPSHLMRVALGYRKASAPCAMAISKAVKGLSAASLRGSAL